MSNTILNSSLYNTHWLRDERSCEPRRKFLSRLLAKRHLPGWRAYTSYTIFTTPATILTTPASSPSYTVVGSGAQPSLVGRCQIYIIAIAITASVSTGRNVRPKQHVRIYSLVYWNGLHVVGVMSSISPLTKVTICLSIICFDPCMYTLPYLSPHNVHQYQYMYIKMAGNTGEIRSWGSLRNVERRRGWTCGKSKSGESSSRGWRATCTRSSPSYLTKFENVPSPSCMVIKDLPRLCAYWPTYSHLLLRRKRGNPLLTLNSHYGLSAVNEYLLLIFLSPLVTPRSHLLNISNLGAVLKSQKVKTSFYASLKNSKTNCWNSSALYWDDTCEMAIYHLLLYNWKSHCTSEPFSVTSVMQASQVKIGRSEE